MGGEESSRALSMEACESSTDDIVGDALFLRFLTELVLFEVCSGLFNTVSKGKKRMFRLVVLMRDRFLMTVCTFLIRLYLPSYLIKCMQQ